MGPESMAASVFNQGVCMRTGIRTGMWTTDSGLLGSGGEVTLLVQAEPAASLVAPMMGLRMDIAAMLGSMLG
jgi:hypothetical protein